MTLMRLEFAQLTRNVIHANAQQQQLFVCIVYITKKITFHVLPRSYNTILHLTRIPKRNAPTEQHATLT